VEGAGEDEENLKDCPVTLRQRDAGPLSVSGPWTARPGEVQPGGVDPDLTTRVSGRGS